VDLLPADLDRLATKGDLASGLAQMRAEMHEAFAVQTRTIARWMISMTITFVTFSVGAAIAATRLT
jgi:hypothetical protein